MRRSPVHRLTVLTHVNSPQAQPAPPGLGVSIFVPGPSSLTIERSAVELVSPITFARRGQQFHLHHCSARCRLGELAVPRRLYTARRRALRLSRMLPSQYSRRRRVGPRHPAVQQDPAVLARPERPVPRAVQFRPFHPPYPAFLPAQPVRFRHARPRGPAARVVRPHLFRLPFLAGLPAPAVRFPRANRRRPAVLAVQLHPFPRSFLGVQRDLEDLRPLPGRAAPEHLGRLPRLCPLAALEDPAGQ
jgi:hypothetical protein